MATELIRFDTLTDADIERWLELIELQPGYESPFFHPHFARTVSRVRNDIFVLIHGEGGRIDLFWPIQKSGRAANAAGAPFSDYHGPIMHPEWSGNPIELLRAVGLTSVRFTTLYDPLHRFQAFASEFDGAHICNVSVGNDDFFENQRQLYPRHTKKMRRLSRKVEREVGELTFNFDDDDVDAWKKVMAWKSHQYRETGRHDVLAPDWVQNLLMLLWKEGAPGCQGYFHTLKHGERLIAAEYNLMGKQTLHGWIPAFDHEFWSYSPGYLIQDEIIRYAAANGVRDYDLGGSAGHYKKYYANFQLPVIGGVVRAPSVSSAIGGAGAAIWRGVEAARVPKVSGLAAKVRRRYGMISTVETTFSGRMKGVFAAACQINARPTKEELVDDSAD